MSSTTRDDGLGRGDARDYERGVVYGVRLREPGVRPLGALRVYGVLQRNIANLEFVMTLQEELERFGFPEHCDFCASSAPSVSDVWAEPARVSRELFQSLNINIFSHMSFLTCVWRFAR